MANSVVVGATAGKVGLPAAARIWAVKANVSSMISENVKAFEAGYEVGSSSCSTSLADS
ncbi:MAG TPA: hypothetical protein GXX40_09725 [Firmicutes bacterium]|nr:hypothetical protein [Bacillota bacterium]